ncbi:hypothetical protein BJ912DRAFT_1062114 [Pholiota molesta]|nr:hypothetical protein BJ912DRAFT_1062114 [Pholiota molesta]
MADIITGGIPAIFLGYYPGWSNPHNRNNAGIVTLTSSGPRDVPQIKFRSYRRRRRGLAGDPAASYWNITRTDELPGPEIQIEAEIKEWIVQETWGRYASCTVPIGTDDDKATMVLGSSAAFSEII